ncbi:MAG: LacI family transcriptional regulator [Firmicutes bacterium]|nr:LacI family transcriptional regulator [Bacillota bacterium]
METERITIYDIAREAGVSPTTVSRVIAEHANVSAHTRKKVRKVIDQYHFTPSRIAQELLSKRSLTLGVILPGVTHPYYAEMFEGAYQEACRLGYTLILFCLPQNEPLSASLMDQIARRRVDGMILSGGIVEATPERELIPMLRTLRRSMPILTICPPLPDVDCINIYSDLSSSVRQSLRHLYNLGHRRIAFLGGSYESRSAGERELGFLDEMKKLDLPAVYRHEAGHTAEAGQLGVIKLLSSLTDQRRPTALICINDLVALGSLTQLHHMGIRVPEDIAVIGCDNQFFAPYTSPPLTTVDLHPAEHGRVAVQQLVAALTDEAMNFSQPRPAVLIIRESCGVSLGARRFE